VSAEKQEKQKQPGPRLKSTRTDVGRLCGGKETTQPHPDMSLLPRETGPGPSSELSRESKYDILESTIRKDVKTVYEKQPPFTKGGENGTEGQVCLAHRGRKIKLFVKGEVLERDESEGHIRQC